MSKIIVAGGRKLNGTLKVPGAKNTVLPILAATVLSGKKSIIKDCPNIADVKLTIDILEDLGCKVKFYDSVIEVDSSTINKTTIKDELMDKMRSSIIFTGAILARLKKVDTTYPGGCELGLRPIDLHIKAFKMLGINVTELHGYIHCNGENMQSAEIHLDFPSVGATENIMLVAMGIKGTTRIVNAAKEPEIWDLQEFLNKLGGNVKGAGTSIIEITGATEYNDVTHTLIPDRIVASTYMAAAALTGSTLELTNINTSHLTAVMSAFKDCGVILGESNKNSLIVSASSRIRPLNLLRTTPFPGFPTDSQSVLISLLSIADGTSIIIESIFEQRFKHIDELRKMGADITVDGRTAIIKGVKKLYGAKVTSPDLRSGAALVLAGLAAEGITEINNIHFIERGYEDIVKALGSVGADIRKV